MASDKNSEILRNKQYLLSEKIVLRNRIMVVPLWSAYCTFLQTINYFNQIILHFIEGYKILIVSKGDQ